MITNTCGNCQIQWTSTSRAELCRPCWLDEKRKPMPTCKTCETPLSSRRSTYCIPCGALARSKPMPHCENCKEPVADRQSKLCGDCWKLKITKPPHLCECGARLRLEKIKQCRDCWRKAKIKNPDKPTACACGAPLSRGPGVTMCRECWKTTRGGNKPTCTICHELLQGYTGTVHRTCRAKQTQENAPRCKDCRVTVVKTEDTRCRPCWNKHKRDTAIVMVGRKTKPRALTSILKEMPCAICGIKRTRPCHIDRIVPELGYVAGNMLQLCPNCHDDVTFGIVERPPATIVAMN